MTDMLPKLFVVHFLPTSFVAEHSGIIMNLFYSKSVTVVMESRCRINEFYVRFWSTRLRTSLQFFISSEAIPFPASRVIPATN
jgi:hypothetical protein